MLADKLRVGGPAGITKVGNTYDHTGSGDSAVVLSTPAGIAVGDVLVVVIGSELSTGFIDGVPAGWTTAYDTGSGAGKPFVYWRFADYADTFGGTYNFSTNSSTGYFSGSMHAYRNAAFGGIGLLGASGTSSVAPSINVLSDDSMLLAVFASNSAATSFSTPSGMSIDFDDGYSSHAVFNQAVNKGASGTRTSTLSSAGCGLLIQLNPADFVNPTPEFIAEAKTQNGSSGASLTISKPTGTVSGDLMIAFMSGCPASWNATSGWTEIADQGSNEGLRIAYKVAGASEGASYTFTATSSGYTPGGSILTFRGAAYDAIGTITRSTATPLTAGSVSASAEYALLLGFITKSTPSNSFTCAGMTSLSKNSDLTYPSWDIFSELLIDAGASGSRTFTGTASTSQILMVIKPA